MCKDNKVCNMAITVCLIGSYLQTKRIWNFEDCVESYDIVIDTLVDKFEDHYPKILGLCEELDEYYSDHKETKAFKYFYKNSTELLEF